MRQSTNKIEFQNPLWQVMEAERGEYRAQTEKKVSAVPYGHKICDQKQKIQYTYHSSQRGQSQPKKIQYFGISKLIESLNRNIQSGEYKFKRLQYKLEIHQMDSYQIIGRKIDMEAEERNWKGCKEDFIKTKLKYLEEQRKMQLRDLEEQRKKKLQELQEQRWRKLQDPKYWEQQIQSYDKTISSQKQEIKKHQIELEYIKSLTLEGNQKIISDIKICGLEKRIQFISSWIKQMEIGRARDLKKYDQCKATMNAVRKDDKKQSHPVYDQVKKRQTVSITNSVAVELNKQKHLFQTKKQDRKPSNSIQCSARTESASKLQIHFNAQQVLKSKITKLKNQINTHKQAMKFLQRKNYQ